MKKSEFNKNSNSKQINHNQIEVRSLQKYKDKRGFFQEIRPTRDILLKQLEQPKFKSSFSQKGVARGLHNQEGQSQIATLMFGEVLYFALDIDKNSETYGELNTYQLSYTGQNQVVAGTRIAHGFYVLSDEAIMLYCTDTDYDPKKENTFSLIPYLKDIDLYNSDVMLSERDRNAKPFVKE